MGPFNFCMDFIFYLVAEEQDAMQADHSSTASAREKRVRQPRKCRKCGQPMKGHNSDACRSMQSNSSNE